MIDKRVGWPPFLPLSWYGEIFPHRWARRGDIELKYRAGLLPCDLDAGLLVFFLPRRFEIAQPELDVADDVDGLVMLDETVCRRVDTDRLEAGVAVQRVCRLGRLPCS